MASAVQQLMITACVALIERGLVPTLIIRIGARFFVAGKVANVS